MARAVCAREGDSRWWLDGGVCGSSYRWWCRLSVVLPFLLFSAANTLTLAGSGDRPPGDANGEHPPFVVCPAFFWLSLPPPQAAAADAHAVASHWNGPRSRRPTGPPQVFGPPTKAARAHAGASPPVRHTADRPAAARQQPQWPPPPPPHCLLFKCHPPRPGHVHRFVYGESVRAGDAGWGCGPHNLRSIKRADRQGVTGSAAKGVPPPKRPVCRDQARHKKREMTVHRRVTPREDGKAEKKTRHPRSRSVRHAPRPETR